MIFRRQANANVNTLNWTERVRPVIREWKTLTLIWFLPLSIKWLHHFLGPLRIIRFFCGLLPSPRVDGRVAEWVSGCTAGSCARLVDRQGKARRWSAEDAIMWDWWMVVNRKSHFDCLITTLSPMRAILMLKGLLLCSTWLMWQFANIGATTSAQWVRSAIFTPKGFGSQGIKRCLLLAPSSRSSTCRMTLISGDKLRRFCHTQDVSAKISKCLYIVGTYVRILSFDTLYEYRS